MQQDIQETGPALSGEAGLTADAARVAHGYADDELHAGFISKQTPLPEADTTKPQGTAPGTGGPPSEAAQGLKLEPAEEREPFMTGEAGSTAEAAGVAHGFVDKDLHAGFISKQTPLQ